MKLIKVAVTVVVCVFATTIHAMAAENDPAVVDALLGPYLAIQVSLAGDDLDAARSGAAHLAQAVESAVVRAAGMADLATSARLIDEATDIESARRGFSTLSHRMMQLVKESGFSDGKTLYVVHCPMALDGEGGSWIQADGTIANPYYGAAMLRCGAVQERLAGRVDGSPGVDEAGHDHSGHQH